MPIGAPIPMPKSGIDSFMEGMANSQKIFDSIANRKNQEAMVDIHQQERDQAKALLPHLIQKYQDAHNLNPLERDHLKAQIASAYAMASLHKSNADVNQFLMGGNPPKNNAPANYGSAPSIPSGSQEVPVTSAPNPDAMNMGRKELVQIANQDQANYDSQHGMTPSTQSTNMMDQFIFPMNKNQPVPVQQQPGLSPHNQQQMQQPMNQPMQPPAQTPPMSAPAPQNMKALEEKVTQGGFKRGPIEVLNEGDPSKSNLDRAAEMGMHSGNFKPVIERKIEDGIQISHYPSGRVTSQKVAPSAEEKEALKLENAVTKEQKKKDIGESAKIEESTKSLVKSAHLLKGLNDILVEHPKLTGPGTGLATKYKLSNSKPAGDFISKAGRLQAELGKYASQRGGAQVIKWVGNVKPDIWNQPDINIGMIKGSAEEIYNDFLDAKASWESKNPGKKFPIEMPDLSGILKSGNKDTKTIDGQEYHLIDGKWHKWNK